MNDSRETLRSYAENRSECRNLLRNKRVTISSAKSISWWDPLIKSEMSSIKMSNISYKDIVTKRKLERKNFHQSMTSLLFSNKSSKSIMRLNRYNDMYPDDLVGTLKNFIKLPEDKARIWRRKQKNYRFNSVDNYEKIGSEVKSTFLKFYDANIEKHNKSIEQVLEKLFSIDIDPLSKSGAVKVNSKLQKVLPDLTIKKIGTPKMMKNEMVTRLIHKDIKSLKRKKRTIAFGKTIANPKSMPNKYDFESKYINMGHAYGELETFQTVWEDILELETTRKFCGWLMNNPQIEPPAYLVQIGALKTHYKPKDNSSDYLLRTLEGYNKFQEPFEFYDMFSRRASRFSYNSLDSLSSSSTLHSLDISDINIII